MDFSEIFNEKDTKLKKVLKVIGYVALSVALIPVYGVVAIAESFWSVDTEFKLMIYLPAGAFIGFNLFMLGGLSYHRNEDAKKLIPFYESLQNEQLNYDCNIENNHEHRFIRIESVQIGEKTINQLKEIHLTDSEIENKILPIKKVLTFCKEQEIDNDSLVNWLLKYEELSVEQIEDYTNPWQLDKDTVLYDPVKADLESFKNDGYKGVGKAALSKLNLKEKLVEVREILMENANNYVTIPVLPQSGHIPTIKYKN